MREELERLCGKVTAVKITGVNDAVTDVKKIKNSCDICKAPAVHKSKWGLFCETCWVLFGFGKRKHDHDKK